MSATSASLSASCKNVHAWCSAEEKQKDLLLLEAGGDGGGKANRALIPKAVDADDEDEPESESSSDDDEVNEIYTHQWFHG